MVREVAVHMCTIPKCGWNTAVHVFGRPEMPETQLHGEEDHVGVDYFRTLGIPILQGRDFSKEDNQHHSESRFLAALMPESSSAMRARSAIGLATGSRPEITNFWW